MKLKFKAVIQKFSKASLYSFVYTLFILSLLPLISFYAGLISFIIVIPLVTLRFLPLRQAQAQGRGQGQGQLHERIKSKPSSKRLLRLLAKNSILGLLLYSACGLYSDHRVSQLQIECQKEKKIVFKKVLSTNPKILNPNP